MLSHQKPTQYLPKNPGEASGHCGKCSKRAENVFRWAALFCAAGTSRKRTPTPVFERSSAKSKYGFNLYPATPPRSGCHIPLVTHILRVQTEWGAPVFQPLLELHDVHQPVPVAVQVLEEDLVVGVVIVFLAGHRGQHEVPEPAQHGPSLPAAAAWQLGRLSSGSRRRRPAPPAAPPAAAPTTTPGCSRLQVARATARRSLGGGRSRAAGLRGAAGRNSGGPPRGKPGPGPSGGAARPGSWKLRRQTRRHPASRTVPGSPARGGRAFSRRRRKSIRVFPRANWAAATAELPWPAPQTGASRAPVPPLLSGDVWRGLQSLPSWPSPRDLGVVSRSPPLPHLPLSPRPTAASPLPPLATLQNSFVTKSKGHFNILVLFNAGPV